VTVSYRAAITLSTYVFADWGFRWMAGKVHSVHNLNIEQEVRKIHRLASTQAETENSEAEEAPMNNLFLKLYVSFQILVDREDGQDMVEYALILALVALGAVAGTKGLAQGINAAFVNLSSKLASNV
jgi:pilus assembly protein Flp/PilA